MIRTMYDSTVTTDIPDDAELVAFYPFTFPGPTEQFTKAQLVRIDNQGDHPELPVIDIESGAASIADLPGWLDEHEKQKGWPGTFYCNQNTLPFCIKAIGDRKCDLWIANPTGTEHVWDGTLPPNITLVATQYAWPQLGSPGHYDLSAVSNDLWFAEPKPVVETLHGIVIVADERFSLTTSPVSSTDSGKTWTHD